MGHIIIIAMLVIAISIFWVNGIDKMQKDHPDYDGSDLFDETND